MLKTLMHRFWQRAPRRLRTTRAGRILILIALAAGLAALNTGNNLLFFGWGMVLSAIVVSGVLSEATLRYLRGAWVAQAPLRAGEPGHIVVQLHNGSRRMPAFGLDASATLEGPKGPSRARAPYALRLGPGAHMMLYAPYTPEARGPYEVVGWEVTTAYPFGFFEKSRRIEGGRQRIFAAPKRVPVTSLLQQLTTHWGEMAAGRPGSGEDFFALRPFRQGDDWAPHQLAPLGAQWPLRARRARSDGGARGALGAATGCSRPACRPRDGDRHVELAGRGAA